MMELPNFGLFFILFSSTTAFTLQNNLKELKTDNISSSIIHSSGCDTGSCQECNCCPGYGLKPLIYGKECIKCDCGKDFGCEFLMFGSKTCHCPDGYTENSGKCISMSIDMCNLYSCNENEVCVIENDEPSCKIRENLCDSNPCKNGGSCTVINKAIICTCTAGYFGRNCELDVCSLFPCNENETCVIENDEPSCKIRENLCETNPCKNGGSCTIRSGTIFCDCTAGYSGPKCEIGCDTGSCQVCNCCPGYGLKPLIFGKECIKCDCGKDFGCEFLLFGSKTCHCPDGYTENSGKCVEKCSLITCQNNGQCVIKDGKARCNCTEEYTGEHCETDKCSQIKCQNGGTCIIQGGKAVCKCTEKYTRTFCQTDLISMDHSGDNIFVSFYLHRNGSLPRSSKFDFHFNMTKTSNRTLTQILLRLNLDSAVQPNINKCSLIKCENGGKCSVENGKAVCTCNERYTGMDCEIDKCSLIKCENGGKCSVENGKAVCACSERYTGMNCEIDKCSLMVCLNGGKCEIRNQKTVCVCPEKFSGDFCERRPSSFTDGIKDYVIEP